jgi:hypothetical protein
LLEVQALQACSFLVVAISGIGLGGPHPASLVFIVAHDLPSCGPHVDFGLPSLPFWL